MIFLILMKYFIIIIQYIICYQFAFQRFQSTLANIKIVWKHLMIRLKRQFGYVPFPIMYNIILKLTYYIVFGSAYTLNTPKFF